MKVLLIEPDPVLARLYAAALINTGHEVVVAKSAQSAVHAADECMPDVVVLELQLARHNGVEFLYEFRSYSEWLHIPIIIHSFVPPSELSSAVTLKRELGVSHILHKSHSSLRQLCMAVQNALLVER